MARAFGGPPPRSPDGAWSGNAQTVETAKHDVKQAVTQVKKEVVLKGEKSRLLRRPHLEIRSMKR